MNTIIVYDSQFGNTERIAQTIAETIHTLGPVQVARVDPEHPVDCKEADLLLLGSPTQGFRATPAMQSFVEKIPFDLLPHLVVASFDTRVHGPWGSAARSLARKLHALKAEILVPPMSFFVKGTPGPLVEGEEERAARWASDICQRYTSSQSHLVKH